MGNGKTNYFGGCDVGSTTGKAVILKDNKIVSSAIIPGDIDPEVTAEQVLKKAIEQLDDIGRIEDLSYLMGTGYGRNEIPFADENMSEISCHAHGVYYCDPQVKTIVDIGGQDVKGISLNGDGSVLEFAMNDKCAAGTGRFLEITSRSFKMSLREFSDLSLTAKKIIPVTSQCSVFAETEIISLLAKKTSPADIAAGIQASVAKRSFTLLKKVGIRPQIAVTGGCSKNEGLIRALEKRLREKITRLSIDPQLMGALGAAVLAQKRNG